MAPIVRDTDSEIVIRLDLFLLSVGWGLLLFGTTLVLLDLLALTFGIPS